MPRSTPSHLAQRFGRLVRTLRTARGLSQEGLAERANLSRDTITRLETAAFSPSLETLNRLVAGLDSSLSTLFAAFEGSDDAMARDILGMARRMDGVELVIAVRVLSMLVAMLRMAHGTDGAEEPASESDV
jgi:transcriptional regulator with XRE-family HTH domain